MTHIDGLSDLFGRRAEPQPAIGAAGPVVRADRARAASIDKAMQLRVLEQHDRLAVGDLA